MQVDADKQIAEIRYFYGGELPDEEFRVGGYRVEPVHAKIRSITYLGERMASERIVWLPATGTLEVALDGRPQAAGAPTPARPRRTRCRAADMWQHLAGLACPDVSRSRCAVVAAPIASRALRSGVVARTPNRHQAAEATDRRCARGYAERSAASTTSRRRRGEIVTFAIRERALDWVTRHAASTGVAAQSSATRGCSPIATTWPRTTPSTSTATCERPTPRSTPGLSSTVIPMTGIGSPADGFRLVSYGTREHALLMRNCRHLISSQIDHYVVRPLDTARFGDHNWRFTFLQHGVTKDDLSRWVNGKPICLFVTATRPEFESIAGDHTPYIFTTKETRLTGFPRHDRLWRIAQDEAERRPTPAARHADMAPRAAGGTSISGGNDRLPLPGFWETEYARSGSSVIESPAVGSDSRPRPVCEITFVPHPNMNDYLDERSFPDHVQVFRYRDVDIQEILASGALMLTDYSSNAFEMAYIERPVVYFQFDRTAFFSGGHVYRKGTWSYDDDGFGPVAVTAPSVIDEVERLIDNGLRPRIAASPNGCERVFPFRDGQSCERVYQAIDDITQPLTDDEYRRLEA